TRTQRANSDPPDPDPLLVYQTQVTTGSCLFHPPKRAARSFLDPITGALLGSFVEQGINQIGQALQEAAKETSDTAGAFRNVEITAQTVGPWLPVVRGLFH